MLLQEFLENSAARLPNKVALICGNERLTYAQIHEKAARLARALKESGIERQDRVAVFLDNSSEAVISIFGILRAEGIFLVLSPTMKAAKLSYILNDCRVKALITHGSKSETVAKALADSGKVEQILWTDLPERFRSSAGHQEWNQVLPRASSLGRPGLSQSIDLDLATIIYTSGSTGNPKGVMLTHINMVSAATSITTYLQNVEDDIILNTLPLSFDYGLYQVLMAFKFGGTVVLERSFTFPYQIIQKMIQEKVTGFPGVPTTFAILLGLKDLNKFDFSNLRYITNTAAALPPEHIQKLRKAFPHVRIYSMYGLTECKRVSYLPPEEIDRKTESVGKGMPNEEVWIADEKDQRIGPGVVGELVVRGSNVMRGYWGLPEETDRALRPGKYPGEVVLYTGDLFRMDDEGFLYFVGRKDDMIKSRGERISPKEIEQCLCRLEGVAEAAVFGMPDEILGQSIQAYIRCHEGSKLDEREVQKHCRMNLEDFLVPQVVKFVEFFPKTSSGKIDKLNLKQIAMGLRDPE